MNVDDITVFTNLRFCSLHRGNKNIIFKNLNFETRFQKLAFSGPQNTIVV